MERKGNQSTIVEREPRKNDESMAQPEFFSSLDVFRHFETSPWKLIDYVEMGLSRQNSIPGFHIAQLARRVGVRLKAGVDSFDQLPECFVKPSRFDNIGLILTMARAMFPRPLV